MESRLRKIEHQFGGQDDGSPLAFIAPNSWDDADRDAWERAEILGDSALMSDLIERYTGIRPRPGRGPRPCPNVMIVPAPPEIEELPEEERRVWRAAGSSPWRKETTDDNAN